MQVKGWNNGSPNNKTGADYGIRLTREDRDKLFKKSWKTISLELGDESVVNVNLSNSFWEDCIELRSAKIGKWMLNNKIAPWEKNNAPSLTLDSIGNRRFRLDFVTDYSKEFSEKSFWAKINKYAKFAKKAGTELIVTALTLYYCAMDSDTPKWAKTVIIGALGYFIMLLDVIPDFTPIIGYTDDFGMLTLALATVAAKVKPEHRQKAREKLKALFDNRITSVVRPTT
jgi:uncharacterized membrane protein YkvA (DUF1232 family)